MTLAKLTTIAWLIAPLQLNGSSGTSPPKPVTRLRCWLNPITYHNSCYLYSAVWRGDDDAMRRALKRRRIWINLRVGPSSETALHAAAQHSDLDIAKRLTRPLLRQNADRRIRNLFGRSALDIAVKRALGIKQQDQDREKLIKVLLEGDLQLLENFNAVKNPQNLGFDYKGEWALSVGLYNLGARLLEQECPGFPVARLLEAISQRQGHQRIQQVFGDASQEYQNVSDFMCHQ